MMDKILVADDDLNICELLRLYLEKEGFEVVMAHDGEEAVAKFESEKPSLILLDIMMPKLDGWQVCRQIRQKSDCPIIMLTAKGETFDKVLGLELGADDYVVKPFDTKEIVARIKAVLRRSSPTPAKPEPAGVACDRATLTVRVDGREVRMPRKEFEILALLLDHPGRIFSREELMARIWPENVVVVERSVDVHIARIRAKIAPYGKHIISRSGYGYGWQD